MDNTRHAGSVAIVTGAGSGIGRATLLALLEQGAVVVGCDVNEAGLDETMHLVKDAGAEATLVPCDVAKEADVQHLMEEAAECGPLVCVANVAGIADGFVPIHELDDETWTAVLDIDLTGQMRMCRSAIRRMMDHGAGGAIVNVASVAALSGGAGGVAYTAAKHGLIGLTKSIAFLYGPAVRCNAVCPGGVQTNLAKTTAQVRSEWAWERLQAALARVKFVSEADRVASVLTWILSSEAGDINGAVITADGGWLSA